MKRLLNIDITKSLAGRTILDIAKNEYEISTSLIGNIKFKDTGIMVNGKRENVKYILNEGDNLCLELDDGISFHNHLLPYEKNLDIVYEDQDLILINKPAGTVVHPSPGHYADSLANQLVWYFGQKNEAYTSRPIGRLDKDTSGLIFFAKNQYSASFMEKCRDDMRLHRIYLALVKGHPSNSFGTIVLPLSPVPDVLNRIHTDKEGLPSRTDYKVLKTFHNENLTTCDYSLVELSLHTGRTHQIRVHMASIGHPLLGDSFYGTLDPNISRTALHSQKIQGIHPETKEPFEFSVSPPNDMLFFTN